VRMCICTHASCVNLDMCVHVRVRVCVCVSVRVCRLMQISETSLHTAVQPHVHKSSIYIIHIKSTQAYIPEAPVADT
jgi:hypothetical protein